MTKNKEIRLRFVKSMKYMGIMMLFWIAILCFIEFNIRRKSKLFTNIFNYIMNKQLFYSEQHKVVRKRKKSFNLLKQSQSMRMYSDKTSFSRTNLLNDMKLRKIQLMDKKSKFSKTMPFIGLQERTKMKSIMSQFQMDSPQTPATVPSVSPTSSIDINERPISRLLELPKDPKLRKRSISHA